MKILMSFPLTPEPLSIRTSNGMLLKTDKAKGMRYLLENQLSPEKPGENITLVKEDGNTFFLALNNISRNFKEIYLQLIGMVSSKSCDMNFSTDMYHPILSSLWKQTGEEVERNLLLKVLAKRN